MSHRRELPGIDALRLGACLVIAAYHAVTSGLAGKHLPALALLAGPPALGPTVTSLFLVLSGFVLFYAGRRHDGAMVRSPREFWRARAARIVPLMLVGHLLAAPFALLGVSRLAPREAMIGGALAVTATQGWFPRYALYFNGPAWSLSVLAFAYLLFPWVAARVVRLPRASAIALLVALWLTSVAVSIAVLRLVPAGGLAAIADGTLAFVHVFPPIRVLEFLSGMVLGHLWLAASTPERRRRAGALLLLPAAATVAAIVMVGSAPQATLGYGAMLPLCWLAIWAAALVQADSALVLGAARALGRSSLAVYLLHDPLLRVVDALLGRGLLGESGGALMAVWFGVLVPLGIVVDRSFVTPVARLLVAPSARPVPASIATLPSAPARLRAASNRP